MLQGIANWGPEAGRLDNASRCCKFGAGGGQIFQCIANLGREAPKLRKALHMLGRRLQNAVRSCKSGAGGSNVL